MLKPLQIKSWKAITVKVGPDDEQGASLEGTVNIKRVAGGACHAITILNAPDLDLRDVNRTLRGYRNSVRSTIDVAREKVTA
ncbi:hypothetical protein [uncultured Novosphingobium sp.]|uniref:hypothetical protein n=1 Tax=uncultured Novosphingobium sp. TaxID=292277 RepID=UPI0025975736|nr:hypothetical protein [uncultured Novosphingobium sp.]